MEEKPIEPETAPPQTPSGSVVPETASPIQIPPKVLEQAKAFGIDLDQIVNWAQTVEQKLAIAEVNFKKIADFLEKMGPLVDLSQKIQQQQQNTPMPEASISQPGGGLGALLPLLGKLAPFFGGGGSSLGDELTKKVLDAGLEQMFAGTQLLKAMQQKLMTEMGVKAVMETVSKT